MDTGRPPKLNSRPTGGKRSPDGTEVDRSRKNGWNAANATESANDIGDDPPPKTIIRRIATSERTMTPDGHIANPLDKAANREPDLTITRHNRP